MKKLHLIIIAVIVIIIVAGVFFKLGFILGEKSLEPTVAQYKKVIDYNFPAAEEIFSISGKIIDIQNKTLSIETIIQDPYVLPDEQKTEIIKVIIADETQISEFNADTGVETEIKLSDLKVGDKVNAGAEENVKDKDEFTAAYVNLIVMPSSQIEPLPIL